jgi:hypothetical protein
VIGGIFVGESGVGGTDIGSIVGLHDGGRDRWLCRFLGLIF